MADSGLSPRATRRIVVLLIAAALVTVGVGTWLSRGNALGDGSSDVDPDRRGSQVYGLCVTCHELDGRGEPERAPPLVGSAYVRGAPEALIRIALDGLQGTRAADGRAYVERMTGFERLADSDIAAVLTFIRRAFGDGASAISTEDVRRVRGVTSGRTLPWTPRELQEFMSSAGGG